MLLFAIVLFYALALVQATARQVDVSPRNLDTDCIIEPSGATISYEDEGLAEFVSWYVPRLGDSLGVPSNVRLTFSRCRHIS